MTEQVTSFRLEIEVFPNWDAVLDWFAEQGLPPDDRVKFKESLERYKGFRFVWFQDRSGLSMIWSDHHRSFIERMEVDVTPIWAGQRSLWRETCASLVIRPDAIIVERSERDLLGCHPSWLSTMPFWRILELLLRVELIGGSHVGLGMHVIREFPPDLAQYLVKSGTIYKPSYPADVPLDLSYPPRQQWAPLLETWGVRLFEVPEAESHRFGNPFYDLHLRLKGFFPDVYQPGLTFPWLMDETKDSIEETNKKLLDCHGRVGELEYDIALLSNLAQELSRLATGEESAKDHIALASRLAQERPGLCKFHRR